ncbi:DEAD/DEAH box helicase [Treponema pectinovorum]|uniref:DEAD/DEAH box helicase n=3 Tax=Treponema pectinovorum TaxID=164 RepID=UPI0011CA967B|nr:DEAD/DEAH box helicase [Treponema pectinovorum]
MDYSQLNLDEKLFKGIQEAGYINCTPVQEEVLNVSLDGRDLYVQSQTGTGKTAAFLITIMQQLLQTSSESHKNALIMVPTRELAVQVEQEAQKLGKYTGLVFASFYGGVGYEEQISKLKKGVDIIIGTPGRIIDLKESNKMDLSKVFYLAIDEADRMFDMGFYPDLRKIVKFLPQSTSRQTMLFSATLNSYVKNLAWEYTHEAKEITIESQNITVDEIAQELIHVSSEDKIRLLLGIIKKENPESLIIFCNTKKMCEILSKRLLINGIKNEYIIGDLPQSKRLKIMNSFKSSKINCLIATDVAARGIDVNDLAMVVNYDLPNEAENYVHRIGRTARAGKSGKAYTFCSEQDVYSLMPIERYIEKQIPNRLAGDEDFVEDKSKDVFIKLDSDEKRNPFKALKNEREKRSKLKKHSKSEKNLSKKEKQLRSSDEELEKLSSMTSDERMQYYKNKYSKQKSDESFKSSSKSKRIDKNSSRNSKKREKNFSSISSKKSSSQNYKVNKKTETKKIGLFSKIKSFFSK